MNSPGSKLVGERVQPCLALRSERTKRRLSVGASLSAAVRNGDHVWCCRGEREFSSLGLLGSPATIPEHSLEPCIQNPKIRVAFPLADLPIVILQKW